MPEHDLRIFIDLDGVCCDWVGKAIQTFGINADDIDVSRILSSCDFSVNKLVSERYMWDIIDDFGPQWWEDIAIFPWAKRLWNECSQLGETCFLTKPSKEGSSAAGKLNWIKEHFCTDRFMIGPRKHLLASPNSVLIDDMYENVANFIQWGGHAKLFPNAFEVMSREQTNFRIEGFDERTIQTRRGQAMDIHVNAIISDVRRIRDGET